MSYTVKEIYRTLQGEGANTGRAAVFCRFSGCNLWTGRESDRPSAICQFCDTDFVGTNGPQGGKFTTAESLANRIAEVWGASRLGGFVVCTGGEPLLQLDDALVGALRALNFEIAIETNGTLAPPQGIDWVCVSPKAETSLCIQAGNELKLVFPQPGVDPTDFVDLDFDHFFLQPMDGPNRKDNQSEAVQYCLQHPTWRLSLQTHKFLGIP